MATEIWVRRNILVDLADQIGLAYGNKRLRNNFENTGRGKRTWGVVMCLV